MPSLTRLECLRRMSCKFSDVQSPIYETLNACYADVLRRSPIRVNFLSVLSNRSTFFGSYGVGIKASNRRNRKSQVCMSHNTHSRQKGWHEISCCLVIFDDVATRFYLHSSTNSICNQAVKSIKWTTMLNLNTICGQKSVQYPSAHLGKF